MEVLGQDATAAQSLVSQLASEPPRVGDSASQLGRTVPEPGTLMLVAAGSVLVCRRRRR